MLAVKAKYENGTVRWEQKPPVEGLHDLIVVFDPADAHSSSVCDPNMAPGKPATDVRMQAIRQMQAMYRSIPRDISLADDLASLPAEARREVFDFIVFHRQRHSRARKRAADKPPSLQGDPFLGMWADRAEMKDSVGWVRETREREWG